MDHYSYAHKMDTQTPMFKPIIISILTHLIMPIVMAGNPLFMPIIMAMQTPPCKKLTMAI
jgi:hypothetical protein